MKKKKAWYKIIWSSFWIILAIPLVEIAVLFTYIGLGSTAAHTLWENMTNRRI